MLRHITCAVSVAFFFSSRRRHTRCALVTGVQTCALPISDVGHAGRLSPEENPVTLLEAEVASLKDQLLRTLAGSENVRRRAQRDREEGLKYAAAPLITHLLEVAATLQPALASVPQERQTAVKGKRVSVRVDPGGCPPVKKKNKPQ